MTARILVVDDNADIAAMLSHLLSIAGHQANVATNGVRALEQIAERDFDLIISDVMMPELDGAGLYRELADRHPRYLGRVIFMTGGHDPNAMAFFDDAAVPVLQKPFSLGDLSREIATRLSGDGRESPPRR